MPTPTVLHSFGESSGDDIFCVVELDTQANKNQYGEEVTSFPPGTDVYILVHLEDSAVIDSISSSYGDIANPNSRKKVTRSNTIETVQFPNTDEEYTIPHIPAGNVGASWEGRSANLIRNGRKIKCDKAPRLCDLTYNFTAYQFRLVTNQFGLSEGDDFNILVSLELSK